MSSAIPSLSVVLPVFNEEALLGELHQRLVATLESLGATHELIYVDDGSSDGSLDRLQALAAADARVKVVALSRNFGHQIAITAGLDHARGEAVVFMDSDLQDPPEVIPDLVARWREGLDVVYARRRARQGDSVLKRSTAYAFYRLMRGLANIDLPPDTGDFRLMSRVAVDALCGLRERRRFVRGLVSWIGFRQGEVLFDRHARAAGQSKYSLRHMLKLALFAIFSFSGLPVTLVGTAGALVCAGALVGLAAGAPAGQAGLFFLGGVQLVGLWVLGQYVEAIADEGRRRPLYLVRQRTNLDPPPAAGPDA